MKCNLFILSYGLIAVLHAGSPVPREVAYSELKPAAPGLKAENPEGLDGRVLAGYQGWFRAEGDGAKLGFRHYEKRGRFEPGSCTIDLWPDLTDFRKDEKFPTPFRHADGTVAHVFSSIHPQTVDRHFEWMAEYGLDGVFVQRFGSHGAKVRRDYRSLQFDNRKLVLARDAAIKHRRAWALMYDLSGLRDDDFDRLAEDWKNLRRRMTLGTDVNDTSYLRLNGKPLVAIWGVGFGDNRAYSLEKCEWFIRLLKHNPDWGGMSIMLGIPYHWRKREGDAENHARLHEVLKLADVLSPWSIGRYRNEDSAFNIMRHQQADLAWCQENKLGYLPVLFPGFSWQNMEGQDEVVIEREGGRFLWRQFQATAMACNRGAYIAMFDEIDEGTAIFKVTNDPPVGLSKFQTFEGRPPDHYLWLVGEGRRLLRGELPSR